MDTENKAPVYVASRASIPERGRMWRRLRDEWGYNIVSSWIDEDGVGQTDDFGELWLRITNEVAQATAVVLYAELDDFPLKGAFIEVGIAIGMNKPIIICLPDVEVEARSCRPVGSWINHPLVTRVDEVAAAMKLAVRADLISSASAPRTDLPSPEEQADNIVTTWRATEGQLDGMLKWYIARAIKDNAAPPVTEAPPPSDAAVEAARGDSDQKWRVALRMFEKSQAALYALRQQVEDTIIVAQTDTDEEDTITAYRFKTGAIHRLLAKAREGDGPANEGDNAALRSAIAEEQMRAINTAATEIANRYFGDYPEKAEPKLAAIISKHCGAAPAHVVFEAGWNAGFQEAQEPDRFPWQNRCEIRFRELFSATPAAPSAGPEEPK